MNIFSKIDCPNNEIIKLFSYHDHFYLCKTHKFWNILTLDYDIYLGIKLKIYFSFTKIREANKYLAIRDLSLVEYSRRSDPCLQPLSEFQIDD